MTVCYNKITSKSQQRKLEELFVKKMMPLIGKPAKKKICLKNKLFRSKITLSTPEHKQHAPVETV